MAAGGSGLGVALAGAFLRDVDAAVDLVAVAAAGALVGYVAGLLEALVDLLVVRRPGAPVYADAPDGWACHYLGTNERLVGKQCSTPEEWAAHNPAPVWRSGRLDEPIDDVICQRGQFSLIPDGQGTWLGGEHRREHERLPARRPRPRGRLRRVHLVLTPRPAATAIVAPATRPARSPADTRPVDSALGYQRA